MYVKPFLNTSIRGLRNIDLSELTKFVKIPPKNNPNADRIESISAGMEDDGFGGHAVQLRRMARDLRAEPAPQVTFPLNTALRACKDAGVSIPSTGKFMDSDQLNMELDRAFDKSDPQSSRRRIKLKNRIYASGLVVEEKHVDDTAQKIAILTLLKAGFEVPKRGRFTMDEINAELDKGKFSTEHRIEIKTSLERGGFLESSVVRPSPAATPSIKVSRHILAEAGIDPPKQGEKIGPATLHKAMTANGVSIERRIAIKNHLIQAGVLE